MTYIDVFSCLYMYVEMPGGTGAVMDKPFEAFLSQQLFNFLLIAIRCSKIPFNADFI